LFEFLYTEEALSNEMLEQSLKLRESNAVFFQEAFGTQSRAHIPEDFQDVYSGARSGLCRALFVKTGVRIVRWIHDTKTVAIIYSCRSNVLSRCLLLATPCLADAFVLDPKVRA
jgi:hypothetical protein